jgi:hypothetical protein
VAVIDGEGDGALAGACEVVRGGQPVGGDERRRRRLVGWLLVAVAAGRDARERRGEGEKPLRRRRS